MSPKSETYTWRLTPALRAGLQEAARREGRTVAQLLDEIVAEKLDALEGEAGAGEERQRQLHARAARFAGRLCGADPRRGERAAALVRERLRGRRRGAI